jgi:hypothetical protein
MITQSFVSLEEMFLLFDETPDVIDNPNSTSLQVQLFYNFF